MNPCIYIYRCGPSDNEYHGASTEGYSVRKTMTERDEGGGGACKCMYIAS